MNARWRNVLRWVGYPALYLLSLAFFLYLTFPYERLRERVEAEINASQQSRGKAGLSVKIGHLDAYWLTGLEAREVRIIPPPADPEPTDSITRRPGATRKPEKGKSDKKKKKRPRFTVIDHVHVSYSVLGSLLSGARVLNFGAQTGDGYLTGYTQDSEALRKVELDLEGVPAGVIPFLEGAIGLPLRGQVSGHVSLIAPEQRLSKADGTVNLTVSNLVVGDGQAKMQGITVPPIRAGELRLSAEMRGGRVTINELSVKGKDVELRADGSIRLRDRMQLSTAGIELRFKFADVYKNKSDLTRAMFDALKFIPEMTKALGSDGFYHWRLTGPFYRPRFRPVGKKAAKRKRPRR